MASQFGITSHSQIQKIGGRSYTFQPDHLGCEECWRNVDDAYQMARLFSRAYAQYSAVSYFDRTADDIHGVVVEMVAR
jgi:hypothetical protein